MSEQTITNEVSVVNAGSLSDYRLCSPFPDAECAFNWLCCPYPYEHTHNYYEVNVVTAGEYLHCINGKTYAMREGDACFVRPHDSHMILASPSEAVAKHVNLLITSDYAERILNSYMPDLSSVLSAEKSELAFRLTANEISKLISTCLALQSSHVTYDNKVFHSKIMVERVLNLFLETRYPLLSSYPKWFSDLLLLLSDPRIRLSIDEIAATTPYSASRLSRIFKDLMGVSVIDYVRRIKLNYAAELLKTTDLNVLEIVYELGYNSVSYFNHTFRDFFGSAPNEFRKSEQPRLG